MIERALDDDGILTLRLAHGKASALDVELLEALVPAFQDLGGARAVILTGTGSIFSAGVDLFRILDGGQAYADRFYPLLSDVVRALFALPVPVVAAVNGHAIAGGGVMTLAADYKVMAEGSGRVGVPELLVGVPFPAAALEVVRFAVSPDRVQALIYTGRTLPPAEAHAFGLVDEVVPADALLRRAKEVASQLASLSPDVFRMSKQHVRAQALARMDGAAEYDRAALALWSAPETHARIRDYVQRTMRR
ncbi:enoyl-CoA hydratase/isomerase family protein [Longimicrobium sp.]|uniref:enoyl-CoA hydratase/isomerase family protein n=1 Tax=Longimicrobium sp. TaxID=2029185 RepID=UPI002E32F9B8|nr:enoyl-CoA hydratase/isomerase family protein [Longimicrobium sp.]HEX6040555.1 enoyl-CoA hydratase/isomerase family protein [Longimicrobium sp.]